MKARKRTRLPSLFLALCMLFSLLPTSAVAESQPLSSAGTDAAGGEQTAQITYSQVSVCFDQTDETIPETAGEREIVLRRGGDIGQALEATLLVYDNNARYGEDYQIRLNGAVIPRRDGATSIYDAFRDTGVLNEGWQLALSPEEAAQADGSATEQVGAADMLAQLDELNVLAARIPLTFHAGQSVLSLTVEVLDDSISEYDESFLLAVLDGEGNAVENGQLLLFITDNEPAPAVTVGFDCAYELIADSQTGLAELLLNRTGDLATATTAILLMNGEAIGYVDFAPYQDTQLVYAQPGVYTLAANDGCDVTGEQVTVASTDGSVTVPQGGDPELDAVPNAYASMEHSQVKAWSVPSWFPGWAKYTSTVETPNYIAYMGSTSGSLYKRDRIGGVGCFEALVDGGNVNVLDTSGTFSRMKTGYVQAKTIHKYDMTGIESIEITGKVEGLDKKNKVALYLNTGSTVVCRNEVSNAGNNVVSISCALPDKYQGSGYVYVENIDPSKSDDGCDLVIPNGFKANKRNYRFVITAPEPLNYHGIGPVNVNIQADSSNIYAQMSPTRSITIAYQVKGDLPVKLVGYKVRNMSTGATSDTIAMDGSSFIFDKAFLKSYEAAYCANTSGTNGVSYPTFEIIPVVEKIPVTVELEDAALGTISIRDYTTGTQLYVGERIVIEGHGVSGTSLAGVYYRKYSDLSSDIAQSGTVAVAASGAVTLDLDHCSRIVLQGSFRSETDQLSVHYGEKDPSRRHGTLGYSEGVVLNGGQYVKNDYFPLLASADEGYVTRWNSNGRYYYGNTFYYQLDANADNNAIIVDFVPKTGLTMKTGSVSGTLRVSDVELRGGGKTTLALIGDKYTVFSDKAYSGTSGAGGEYTIADLTAVVGGTYSMMVTYRGMVGYANFVPFPDSGTTERVDVTMPQFASGSVYPSQVQLSLGNATSSQNVIQVRPTDSGEITIRVTNESNCTVKGVTLHFLSTRAADYGSELTTINLTYNEALTLENDSSVYSYWTAKITDTGVLPVQSQMYVSVKSVMKLVSTEVQTDDEGNVVDTAVTILSSDVDSGMVNTGYQFISAINDTSIAVEQSIPDIPGAQNAYSVDTAALKLPLLGSADFSITSATGGYFVQKVVNGTTYLICGYSITPIYGTGTLQSKYDGANKTSNALAAIREADIQQKGGEADVVNVLIGQGNSGGAGTPKEQTAQKTPSNFALYPAYMFKFALTPGVDAEGNSKNYVTGFEMALGFDANYLQNIPFSIYGLPFYLCFSTQVEALAQAQYSIAPGTAEQGSDMSMTLYEMCQSPEAVDSAVTSRQSFFAVPKLSLGLKAGAGYNAFASVYVNGTVEMPLIFQFYPNFDAAGKFGFSISAGADLVFFTANYKLVNLLTSFGNEALVQELSTIQGFSTSAGKGYHSEAAHTSESLVPTLEEMLNSMTFSMMERPASSGSQRRTTDNDSTVLAQDVFKNTSVQLVRLDNGSIMALFLKDNGEAGYNYLSASYAISTDEGKTWSQVQYVNSSIGQAHSALQFDINVFSLEDRMLITWSEADFNTRLQGLDANNLTIPQIAALMNAMNLRGRFFDTATGEPMGEAFTIAENSTVACGALDAVQNGDNVYVYYQRNVFPTAQDTQVYDLLATERTIAMARARTSDPATWISTPVRATNESGQQYRITEVEPFVHDGIMGEVLVLDRNGKLALYDEESGEWTADNEDRQLYLRTYDFAADGTPCPTALLPLTDANRCAQSPQVVSSDNYLHLFWNENGDVVYITDFAATDQDHADVQAGAVVLKNSDGTVTAADQEPVRGNQIAGSDTLTVGTTFTASMAEDGNVLLSWIANDEADGTLVPTEEIYGVILNTVTNAEAITRSGRGGAEDDGNENVYQLWAVGTPIALTDGDNLIGALDSICMESGSESKFLLAYTRLNAAMRTDVTSADLLAVQSVDAPAPVLDQISAPNYPMPGSQMTVQVTAVNNGLEPLYGAEFTASGIGEPVRVTYSSTIAPGETATVDMTVAIPADFSRTTELVLTVSGLGDQARYSDQNTATVSYGAYFSLDEMSQLISIPNSTDCEATTRLKNIGNAAGCPTLTFTNTIYGSDEYHKEYVFQYGEAVAPGKTVTVTHVLKDTLMNKEKTANLVVSLGDGYDQSADSLMPVPVINVWQDETPIETVFTDVADHWAKDSLEYVYNRGLMNGMSQTTFRPDAKATRAMLVTVLYRMAGQPQVNAVSPFADVPANLWYSDAITWAAEAGIVKGCGHGVFKPDEPATREQTAAILYRCAGFMGWDTSAEAALTSFKDSGLLSDYAVTPMSWAYAQGLIKGVSETRLCPLDGTTRAQLAVMLKRFCEKFGV